MDARNLPCGAVVLDTMTSLLPTKLDDDTARIVTAHMHLIANELVTCCIGVQHTWRSDNEKHIGPYSLSANMDGTFIATGGLDAYQRRYADHANRAAVQAAQKRQRQVCVGVYRCGRPAWVNDNMGKPMDAVAMRCTGYTAANEQTDSLAVRRAWIAQCLPPGRTAALGAVCKLCGWARGTPQYDWIREAILTEWITVVLSDGETRELRRIPRGQFELIECRMPDPPPNSPR